ncbi:MAG: hypothetical protein J6328_02380 [Bacilli bacterium]|nr:hypothetical protein [Bacilli bacterium]
MKTNRLTILACSVALSFFAFAFGSSSNAAERKIDAVAEDTQRIALHQNPHRLEDEIEVISYSPEEAMKNIDQDYPLVQEAEETTNRVRLDREQEDAKPLVDEDRTDLVADDARYIWGAVGVVVSALVLVLGVAYLLLFFYLNEWVLKNGVPQRIVRIGNKGKKVRVLHQNLAIDYRYEHEIYESNEKALE